MAADSPRDMLAAVASSLKERTGSTLTEWIGRVRAAGLDPLDQKGVRLWLKTAGVGQNSAWAIADAVAREAGFVPPSLDAAINAQFAGARAPLRQIAIDLGPDVRLEPRSSYIPFIRHRQFQAIESTARGLEVGMRLPEPPPVSPLQRARGLGQSTHKVLLENEADLSAQCRVLIDLAYRQN
jgi:predicted transport protein